jgi:hypothetical protein
MLREEAERGVDLVGKFVRKLLIVVLAGALSPLLMVRLSPSDRFQPENP